MPVYMKPTSVIMARLGVQKGGPVHAYFTAECAREMDPFVPFDKGTMAGTVIEEGMPTKNVTVDTITYAQNYAKVVYHGVRKGKPITIHTDKHAKATTYWDKRMWSVKGKDIVQAVQDFSDRGGK